MGLLRFLRWTRASFPEARAAETKLLSTALGAHPGVSFHCEDTAISSARGDTVHSIHVSGKADGKAGGKAEGAAAGRGTRDLVLLHGYGTGAGVFFRNLARLALSPLPGACVRVHAVDWRGAGISGRPEYTPRSTEEAERWFVEGLETWRQKQHPPIERLTLLGHSMGGMIASHYAAAHPERVEHLLLAGPAGMAKRAAPMPKDLPLPLRAMLALWERGGTPGGVVRAMGPAGPRVVGSYVGRRFFEGAALSAEEAQAYAEYQYQILGQPGSGEHCLNLLMEPIGYPRTPIAPALEALDCPVTWIYGVNDWMSPRNGQRCAERRAAAGKQAECVLLDGAGHYCFMNNDRGFDAAVLRAMAATHA